MAQPQPPPSPAVGARPRTPGLVIAAGVVLIVAGTIRTLAGIGGLTYAVEGLYETSGAIEAGMLASGALELFAGISLLARWSRFRAMALALTALAIAYMVVYALFNDDLPALLILPLDAFALVALLVKRPGPAIETAPSQAWMR